MAWANTPPPSPSSAVVELTPEEQAWLADNPEILIGTNQSWTPYVKPHEDGSITGIEPEIIARINALTGANIRLVLGDWAAIVARAERGELHGLALSAKHPQRAKNFLFSASPYSLSRYVYAPGDADFRSMEDLEGKRVGYLEGNLAERKILAPWPKIHPVPYPSNQAVAAALLNGETDAAISGISLLLTIREELFPDLRLAFSIPDTEVELRYSIHKSHPELLGIIDKALAAMGPDTIQSILKKWGAARPIRDGRIDLTSEERAWLAEHREIRFCSSPDRKPYDYRSENQAKGIFIDYMRLAAERIGFKPVPVSAAATCSPASFASQSGSATSPSPRSTSMCPRSFWPFPTSPSWTTPRPLQGHRSGC